MGQTLSLHNNLKEYLGSRKIKMQDLARKALAWAMHELDNQKERKFNECKGVWINGHHRLI